MKLLRVLFTTLISVAFFAGVATAQQQQLPEQQQQQQEQQMQQQQERMEESLVECPECGKKVHEQAAVCIHCGEELD